MTRIKTGGVGAGGAVSGATVGSNVSAGALAHQAMAGLAGKMAASISGALGLVGTDSADQWHGNSNDPYDIEELVEELASGVGGTVSEAGELSRALHAFVQESAALFAARPESRSLAFLHSVISQGDGGSGQGASLTAVSHHIEAATTALRGPLR